MPSIFWKKLSFLKSMFFSRLLYLRVYCGMQNEITKIFHGNTKREVKKKKDIKDTKNRVYNFFKDVCRGTSFTPLFLFLNAKTSSHYAGCNPSFLSHINDLKKHNIFITDSSIWKSSPTKSPTITIMANATQRTKRIFSRDIS